MAITGNNEANSTKMKKKKKKTIAKQVISILLQTMCKNI
jgi:hypothetical protein